MPTCSNNVVEPPILKFQLQYTIILHHRRNQAVRPAQHPEQDRMLSDIWNAGRLGSDGRERVERLSNGHGEERSWEGWRKIGLYVEDEEDGEVPFLMEVELFRDVGELGLECLVNASLRVACLADSRLALVRDGRRKLL